MSGMLIRRERAACLVHWSQVLTSCSVWPGLGLALSSIDHQRFLRFGVPMISTSVVSDLTRAHLDGAICDSTHADYDRLRRIHNAVIERKPAAIVRAVTASDVQKVVRIAADRDVPLAVRCGGHSFAGLGTCDHGIVCDLSRMNAVLVDPQTRTVDVGGGALLGDVDAAGEKYGLVTPAGVVSHTGVGG